MTTVNIDELARLARRDNNTRRPWLLVNPLQGKHIPCSPSVTFSLFSRLSSKVYAAFKEETLLVIGFAETATAIGAAIAACAPQNAFYLPTTREDIPGTDPEKDYLFFSETHSHATEQRLCRKRLDDMLEQVDRIVFAEDEVTTGNTILQAVDALTGAYPHKSLNFGVASILNGMEASHHETFRKRGIPCIYLAPLQNESFSQRVSQYNCDSALCYRADSGKAGDPAVSQAVSSAQAVFAYENLRLGLPTFPLLQSCMTLTSEILRGIDRTAMKGARVLVLGTEEFMFPPLFLANFLEQNLGCASVSFHATTRSPILPCSDPDYPISARYGLHSVYDSQRTTYIYNLTAYDRVLIIHDGQDAGLAEQGLADLCQVLRQKGCADISIFQWTTE